MSFCYLVSLVHTWHRFAILLAGKHFGWIERDAAYWVVYMHNPTPTCICGLVGPSCRSPSIIFSVSLPCAFLLLLLGALRVPAVFGFYVATLGPLGIRYGWETTRCRSNHWLLWQEHIGWWGSCWEMRLGAESVDQRLYIRTLILQVFWYITVQSCDYSIVLTLSLHSWPRVTCCSGLFVYCKKRAGFERTYSQIEVHFGWIRMKVFHVTWCDCSKMLSLFASSCFWLRGSLEWVNWGCLL